MKTKNLFVLLFINENKAKLQLLFFKIVKTRKNYFCFVYKIFSTTTASTATQWRMQELLLEGPNYTFSMDLSVKTFRGASCT